MSDYTHVSKKVNLTVGKKYRVPRKIKKRNKVAERLQYSLIIEMNELAAKK